MGRREVQIRFNKLLEYLGLSQAAFARELGYKDPSPISRFRSGRRGLTDEFMGRCRARFGVPDSYWLSAEFRDPEDCIQPELVEGARAEEDAPVRDDAAEIGVWTARLGIAPAEMVGELLNTCPPEGAGAPFWVRRWVELAKKHGVDLRPTSSGPDSSRRR